MYKWYIGCANINKWYLLATHYKCCTLSLSIAVLIIVMSMNKQNAYLISALSVKLQIFRNFSDNYLDIVLLIANED